MYKKEKTKSLSETTQKILLIIFVLSISMILALGLSACNDDPPSNTDGDGNNGGNNNPQEPTYSELKIKESDFDLVNIAAGEKAYFKFTPVYTSEYEITITNSCDSTLYINQEKQSGVGAGQKKTYKKMIVAGSEIKIIVEANEAVPLNSNIVISPKSDLRDLSIAENGTYLVKLSHENGAMQRLDIEEEAPKFFGVFTMNVSGEFAAHSSFYNVFQANAQGLKNIDVPVAANANSYVLINNISNTTTTLSINISELSSISAGNDVKAELKANCGYTYFKLNAASNTYFQFACNSSDVLFKVYTSNGSEFTAGYNAGAGKFKLPVGDAGVYFIGVASSENVTVTLSTEELL